MADMKVFVGALDTYLEQQGFGVRKNRFQRNDGHQLRAQISDIRSSSCVMDGTCQQMYVKNLLQAMRDCSIPEWTDEHARSALEVAGFNPNQYLN